MVEGLALARMIGEQEEIEQGTSGAVDEDAVAGAQHSQDEPETWDVLGTWGALATLGDHLGDRNEDLA